MTPNQIVGTLEGDVFNVFRRAYETKRLDVAEHLLRALEEFQTDIGNGVVLDAYALVCGKTNLAIRSAGGCRDDRSR